MEDVWKVPVRDLKMTACIWDGKVCVCVCFIQRLFSFSFVINNHVVNKKVMFLNTLMLT